jgi:uncharacterized iron-regulated membrane protein
MFCAASEGQASYDAQLEAARAALPDGYTVTGMAIRHDPARATGFVALSDDGGFERIYVDHHTGRVLGRLGDYDFFAVVLRIHRSLFVGTTGRIIVELVTCWTIVLLVSGAYLWWPRNGRVWGVWLPRLGAKPYAVLRDLHAVAGFYLLPIAIAIALTGLLYTFVWGSGYFLAVRKTSDFAALFEGRSTSNPSLPAVSLDSVAATARRHLTEGSVLIQLPHTPDGAFMCTYWGDDRPTGQTSLVIDRGSGEVLRSTRTAELPALAWWSRWNYAVHVGSLLGLATKVIWLLTCIVLAALPITGVWMWWKRRPKGRLGLPRRVRARLPLGLVAAILAGAVFLPVAGLSLVAILMVDAIVARAPRSRLREHAA